MPFGEILLKMTELTKIIVLELLKRGEECSDGVGKCAEGLSCKIPFFTSCTDEEKCKKKCVLMGKGKYLLHSMKFRHF